MKAMINAGGKQIELYGRMDIVYERNPGNHYQDAELLVARGIKWTLEKSIQS